MQLKPRRDHEATYIWKFIDGQFFEFGNSCNPHLHDWPKWWWVWSWRLKVSSSERKRAALLMRSVQISSCRFVCEREESSVMPSTSALLRTVRAVDGSYAPYKPSALLTVRILSTYGTYVSLLHQGTVCYGSYDPYAWLIHIVFIPHYNNYIRHKSKTSTLQQ